MSEDTPRKYASSPCMAHELEADADPSFDVARFIEGAEASADSDNDHAEGS